MASMSDLNERLAALKKKYAVKLNAMLLDLEQQHHGIKSSPQDRDELLSSAIALSHKLHGTSGTYGFGEVSKHMSQVEVLLRKLQSHPNFSQDIWESALKHVEQAIATHKSSLS